MVIGAVLLLWIIVIIVLKALQIELDVPKTVMETGVEVLLWIIVIFVLKALQIKLNALKTVMEIGGVKHL